MAILGIGTDIINKNRFNQKKVEKKFLTNIEKEILKKIKGDSRIDFISGRWAAKESIIKASNKKILFSNISIIKDNNGKPLVLIDGKKANNIHISITHDNEYTMAFCVIENV